MCNVMVYTTDFRVPKAKNKTNKQINKQKDANEPEQLQANAVLEIIIWTQKFLLNARTLHAHNSLLTWSNDSNVQSRHYILRNTVAGDAIPRLLRSYCAGTYTEVTELLFEVASIC